ncbi:hypothetical protein TURU_096751 [Turdus rufiventris]|nr:hypothetical protein TURU_096751 [Turdus rufiventris]
MQPPALSVLLLIACFGSAWGNLSRDESQPTTSDETVVAGGTVVLKCQVEDPDDSSLQWSNPAQQTLYFGEKRALRDNRIQLERSTPNELTISISDVVLADEGEYTCSIFTMPVRTAKALVTVLGIPQKPQIFGHEQPIDEEKVARLICRSSGSKPAAQLRWRKGNRELKDASPVPSTSSTYHAMIGGVVAVIVFLLLSLLIVLGHYLIRHKGTYLTHEAKGSDDAPDADTAIINAEGGQGGGDDKKEYFI